jgi:hypothetical protein
VSFVCREGFDGGKNEKGSKSQIPKKIWTFWDDAKSEAKGGAKSGAKSEAKSEAKGGAKSGAKSGEIPEVVEKCIKTWRKYNPKYTIVILNRHNLAEYCSKADEILGSKFADSPQRLSDMVRLCVLYEHGGIWADATIIVQQSLDFIFEEQESRGFEFYGYTIRTNEQSRFTQIESWFFGAVPESHFVGLWRDALMEMNKYDTLEEYLESIVAQGVTLDFISNPLYFLVYCSEQLVLQKLLPAGYAREHFSLSESEKGPFQFAADHSWKAGSSLDSLCREHKKYRKQPMHKLMGHFRDLIIAEPARFACLDETVFRG